MEAQVSIVVGGRTAHALSLSQGPSRFLQVLHTSRYSAGEGLYDTASCSLSGDWLSYDVQCASQAILHTTARSIVAWSNPGVWDWDRSPWSRDQKLHVPSSRISQDREDFARVRKVQKVATNSGFSFKALALRRTNPHS
eukprot:5819597-Amphidinium_carterae.1